MRKIKNKAKEKLQAKETEKRNKKMHDLTVELIEQHNKIHNVDRIREIGEKILEMKPEHPSVVENVASICIDNKIVPTADKAVTYMEEHFEPTCYRVFLRSRVADLQVDYGTAIERAEKALTLEPVEMLHRMMIHNILGHLYRYAGNGEKSLEHYEKSAKMDFTGLENHPALAQCEKIRREDFSNMLFSYHNVNVSREKLMEEILAFNKLHEHEVPFTHSPETHPRHEKIRVGYVSPDIRRHVVAFFSYALWKNYDKSKFEVYLYAKNLEDGVTAEFKRGADKFVNINFDTPQVAAQKIKDDEIDILVDLSGHTANNCLDILAYKPAPVQISGIGWFNTTGFKPVDYFMVDKYTDPVGLNEKFFTEKLLRLQHSHFCYMWHDAPVPVAPAPCTKNGFVTFVSFNTFAKVTDEMLRIWAKILDAVPGSKLFLKGKNFREKYGTEYTLKRCADAGIPAERLIYEADAPVYLHRYHESDIALDTFPYPGGGTTCDALYMGVPVITLVGERHNSRFGYSLLHNMGLDELCAFSEEEYIQKAVELANDWDRIRDYHLTLRRQMETSPIMDDVIYMAEVEDAYEKIFHAWQAGEELPDFPQDAPEITPELAEEFYNRAMHYINLENEGKDVTHIKRALYYFEQAEKADKKHDAEIYLFTAACRQELLNYAGAYEAIVKCGEVIDAAENPADFSDTFRMQYHERRAKLAQYNGKSFEAAEHYEQAANLATGDAKLGFVSDELLCLHFLNIPSADLAAAHFAYQKLVENIPQYTTYHEKNSRIKVGYVSADFRQHAIFPIALGIIAAHNRAKFEVFCYSRNESDDVYTNIVRQRTEHFVDVQNLSYAELAEKIHADNIDILVDLSGHSAGNVLPTFAYKPAPVQVSGIGYMDTTGLSTMDYFITDRIVDPVGEHEKYFSEKLLQLPCQFCYAQNSDIQAPTGAPCKKNNFVTFGTICRYSKVTDDMLKVWKVILDKVPTAKFIMRAQEFASISVMNQAYARMKALGINMDQVLFQPAVDKYFDVIKNELDIVLDSYPYVGGSTTMDALFVGVPVITMYGERRNTRFGYSILTAIGANNLAVNSVEEYINLAVAYANDFDALDEVHRKLHEMVKNSKALNPVLYTQILEQAYTSILDEKFAEVEKAAEVEEEV